MGVDLSASGAITRRFESKAGTGEHLTVDERADWEEKVGICQWGGMTLEESKLTAWEMIEIQRAKHGD